MSDARMTEAETIFQAALDSPPDERHKLLADRCRGDPELRALVERLLAHHDAGMGSFLDSPVDRTAEADQTRAATEESTSRPVAHPERIGPYRILEKLGEGGFGDVYAAEQTEPVKRRVALKILKAGMDTRAVLARFEAERQALALMDHPHIAKVLDAGETELGRPYFVMELIRGEPITDYCDRQRLSLKERLGLFIPVCQAIQHAHQKSVIHRDIKPGNVLIATVDGKPAPKVIDFGIAKATAASLTDKTLYTLQGQVIGTPAYMSPEQAEMTGLNVDTRTDVYSLGVLLYELMTGTLPFETKTLMKAGIEGMQRIIREKEPSKPSTRISSLGESATDAASRRRTQPQRLRKLVSGELDWITMKALEKDPSRRYETATSLAMDVRRYLSDEPVLAGPPSAAYRTRKFAKRNKVAIAFVGAIFLALAAGFVESNRQRLKAETSRAEAEQARADAERERTLAEELRYGADMQLAATLWETESGTAGSVQEILLAHVPEAGEPDRRELSWRFQWTLTRGAKEWWGPALSSVCRPREGGDRILTAEYADQELDLWQWTQAEPEPRHLGRLRFEGGQCSEYTISEDGSTVAISNEEGMIQLFDGATARASRRIRFPGQLLDMELSGNGVWLACIGGGHVRVYEVATGGEAWSLVHPGFRYWDRHFPRFSSRFGVSPDGDMVVMAGIPDHRNVSVATVNGIDVLEFHRSSATTIAVDSNRRRGYSGDMAGWVAVWDLATRELIGKPLELHRSSINTMALSTDGSLLAAGAPDGSIVVWDLEQGISRRRLAGHTAEIFTLSFSDDGRSLSSTARDRSVLVWDLSLDSGETLELAGADEKPATGWNHRSTYSRRDGSTVTDLEVSPDGQLLAVAARESTGLELWNLWTKKRGGELGAGVQHVAFSPDGRRIALGLFNGRVEIRNHRSGETLRTLEDKSPESRFEIGRVVFSPDGRYLALGHGWMGMSLPDYENTVELWDVEAGSLAASLQVGNSVNGLSFTPDGKTLAAASRDGVLRILSIPDLSELHVIELDGASAPMRSAAYSPDGTLLATAGNEQGKVTLWDTATYEPVAMLEGHADVVMGLTFTPDSRTLVTGSWDNTVKLWDVASRRLTRTLRGRRVYSVAVTPDGNTVVAGGRPGWAQMWDSPSAAEIDAVLQERVRELADVAATRGIDSSLDRLWKRRNDEEGRSDQCDLVSGLDIGSRGRRLRRAILLYDVCQRPEAAFAEFASVLETDPAWAQAWNERGSRLLLERRFEEAMADLDRAVELAPYWGEPRERRGAALYCLGRVEESWREFARAGELGSYLRSIQDLAYYIGLEGRYEEAEALYRKTLEVRRSVLGEKHQDTGNTRYNLACILALLGRRSDALSILRDAVDNDYRGPSSFYGRGQTMLDDSDLTSLHGDPEFEAIAEEFGRRNEDPAEASAASE